MASASTSVTCGLASPAAGADRKSSASKQLLAHSIIGLPALPTLRSIALPNWQSVSLFGRRTTSASAATAGGGAAAATGEVTTELPEIIKTLQETWDKVDDKYAVSSLALASFVGLWCTSGAISAVDRLPIVPGLLEIVGIGYTGWFAYRNLLNKPDREALIAKAKRIYNDILGSSSSGGDTGAEEGSTDGAETKSGEDSEQNEARTEEIVLQEMTR